MQRYHIRLVCSHVPTTVAPRPAQLGGRPPYPTETMVRISALKRLHHLSDEQSEFQLLDQMSFNASAA